MADSERSQAANATTTPATTTPATTASPAETGPSADAGADSRHAGQRSQGHDHPSGATTTAGSSGVDGLRCDLLMNARYHASRGAFLDTTHRVLMFLIIVFGATAIVDLFPLPWPRSILAALTVIFAALDLTADLSNRARCHALMKRRYFELLAELAAGRKTESETSACMHRYSAEEEPAFHALLSESWNAAQEMVYGDKAHAVQITPSQRVLKNIWRYSDVKFPPLAA